VPFGKIAEEEELKMTNQWDLMRNQWKYRPAFGEYGVQVLNKPLNSVMMREEIPRAWRQSILGPLFNITLARCMYFRLLGPETGP